MTGGPWRMTMLMSPCLVFADAAVGWGSGPAGQPFVVGVDANYALEDYEIARGYILTCQSYPTSDRLVVDFDK